MVDISPANTSRNYPGAPGINLRLRKKKLRLFALFSGFSLDSDESLR
jgi:hypothetical protein